jgi:hypothetical protein
MKPRIRIYFSRSGSYMYGYVVYCEKLDAYIVILERYQTNCKGRCQYVFAIDGPAPICRFYAHMN